MDWQALGVGLAAGSALITANAVIMKFVIKAAVTESLLKIHDQFVTKEHMADHVATLHRQ